jgi:hypothetical protein
LPAEYIEGVEKIKNLVARESQKQRHERARKAKRGIDVEESGEVPGPAELPSEEDWVPKTKKGGEEQPNPEPNIWLFVSYPCFTSRKGAEPHTRKVIQQLQTNLPRGIHHTPYAQHDHNDATQVSMNPHMCVLCSSIM